VDTSDNLQPTVKLTPGIRAVLQEMSKGEELVFETGGGWWIGDRRTNGSIAMKLLRFCLITSDSYNEIDEARGYLVRYSINEDGLALLNDPYYVPRVVRAMAEVSKRKGV